MGLTQWRVGRVIKQATQGYEAVHRKLPNLLRVRQRAAEPIALCEHVRMRMRRIIVGGWDIDMDGGTRP